MFQIAQIALIGWPLLGLALFFVMPPRKAIIFGAVFSFLFLPWVWDTDVWALHSRDGMIMVPLLVGAILFGGKAWSKLKLCSADLAMIAWCLSTPISLLANGFEWYHVLAGANAQVQVWALPYLLGRVFLPRLKDMRQLATAIFLGALVYVPLCLFEIRFSPQLHSKIYGFYPHAFIQNMRYGGFRATVFLDHGLTVAMWLSFAALAGFWLWRSRAVRTLWGIPVGLLLLSVVLTFALCKSLGSILLFGVGCLFYFASRVIRGSILVWILLAVPTAYVALRLEGMVSTRTLNSLSANAFDEDRTGSFTARLEAEELFVDRALQRPWLGWGGWERWRVHDRFGNDIAASDAFWTIVFGKQGFVGLISLALVLCLPILLFLRRYPFRLWSHPEVAPAAALAIFIALSQIDMLFNVEATPVLMLAVGGLAAVGSVSVRRVFSRQVVIAPPPPQPGRVPELA